MRRCVVKRSIIAIVLAIGVLLASVAPAAATVAMKPGYGWGDANHVHCGAPGRLGY